MKNLVIVLMCMLLTLAARAQPQPSGFPSQIINGWIQNQYVVPTLGSVIPSRDTNWIPRFVGMTITWPHAGVDTVQWFWTGIKWMKNITTIPPHPPVLWGTIGGTLSNQTDLQNALNLKLNITDTTNKWVTRVFRKIGSDSVFYTKGGVNIFAYRDSISSGGAGTVTSVALSMPSAFSVSGSPITGAGTLVVNGAGSSLQYITGAGTLRTFDTGAIPNFYLKVRGLLSGTSPITYSTTTGQIGINNATASGQKGAATFNGSDFSDNGSGLISLSTLGIGGSCVNCNVTFDTKGRATSFSNGASLDGKYRRSITKTLDSLQLVNDSVFTSNGRRFTYQSDTSAAKGFKEDKYVVAKTYTELRGMRIADTSYIFRVNYQGVVGDYIYDPNDVTTTDDTVVTIVTAGGLRYKRYIPDGTYDPRFWDGLAGVAGHNATVAVQNALRAIGKYTTTGGFPNGKAGTILLHGDYVIDPSTFIYPNVVGVIEIKGNVTILGSWTIPRNWSLIGYSNASSFAQFGEGNFASITTGFVNATSTPIPAVQLQGGSNYIKGLSIDSHTGIGLMLNGTALLPAALSTVEDVAVGCFGWTGGEQIGIYVADWFWARFIRCAANVEQDVFPNKPGSSVKIVGETLEGNYSYLLYFDHLVTQGRPIRIQCANDIPSSGNVAIFNVQFDRLIAENIQYDTAAVVLNGINIGIANIQFNMCATADCPSSTYFLKNENASWTNGVYFNGPFDRNLYTGSPIFGVSINNLSKGFPYIPVSITDAITSVGYTDVRNLNKAWTLPADVIKYNAGGGQLARNASQLAALLGGAPDFTAPYVGWNGDTSAIRILPNPTNYRDILFKTYNKVYHTGDIIIFGCWLKTDSILFGTSLHSSFNFGSAYKFRESGTGTMDDDTYPQITDNWQFVSTAVVVDASGASGTDLAFFGIRVQETYDTTYMSNPFIIYIDSASNVPIPEAIRYAKEFKGGTFGVPVGAYSIRNDAPLYISDSTRFVKGVLQKLIGAVWTPLNFNDGIAYGAQTATGDYTQNWHQKQWRIDSIGTLLRMEAFGGSAGAYAGMRWLWQNSTPERMDLYAARRAFDNSSDSTRVGLFINGGNNQFGYLSLMGTIVDSRINATRNNLQMTYSRNSGARVSRLYIDSTRGIFSAPDSLYIKGATAAATADSVLAVLPAVSNADPIFAFGNKIMKIPIAALTANIYNTNGTITGNRAVAGGGFSLGITGLSTYTLNTTGQIQELASAVDPFIGRRVNSSVTLVPGFLADNPYNVTAAMRNNANTSDSLFFSLNVGALGTVNMQSTSNVGSGKTASLTLFNGSTGNATAALSVSNLISSKSSGIGFDNGTTVISASDSTLFGGITGRDTFDSVFVAGPYNGAFGIGRNRMFKAAIGGGVYTPTVTNVTNASASTAYQCQYIRVGNVVTVSGKVDIDPTASGAVAIAITLPFSSAVPNDYNLAGTGVCGAVTDLQGSLRADTVNDRAELNFVVPAAGTVTNQSWYFTFTYLIDNS